MNILALDQSSHLTGFAIFNKESKQLEKYGLINANDKDLGERLVYIRNEIKNIILSNNIEFIIFEDIQLQNNVTNNVATFKTLAEVFGVLYELATEMGIPNTAVLSTVWKKTLGVKGKTRPEQKENAQKYVQKTFQVSPSQDECDAICIGSHYLSQKEHKDLNWSI